MCTIGSGPAGPLCRIGTGILYYEIFKVSFQFIV